MKWLILLGNSKRINSFHRLNHNKKRKENSKLKVQERNKNQIKV